MIIEQSIKSLSEILSLQSIRRTLWVILILASFVIAFESQTQFLAIQSLNQRADLLAKISASPNDSNQIQEIGDLKTALITDFKKIEKQQKDPLGAVMSLVVKFIQGCWIVLPLGLLMFKLIKYFILNSPENYRAHAVWYGLQGFSMIAWLATALGLISIQWNNSQNFFVNWIIFPSFSSLILFIVASWAALLKTIVPNEKAMPNTKVKVEN